MNSLLLSFALLLSGATETTVASPADALRDGTLIFLENVSSAVELTTHGEIGHVALVFHDGGAAWVYEATPARVRRVTMQDYSAELARLNRRRNDDGRIHVWALQPKPAYTADEVAKMRAYLDAQLGRRYSVKNYVRGKPYDGIHCAELASSMLNQSGRFDFENCHKLNPQALYAALLPTHSPPEEFLIPPPAAPESWSIRAQRRCSEWFTWCGWSCREAWLFCW